MAWTRFAPVLCLPCVLSAQQGPIEVQDLVAPASLGPPQERVFVDRAFLGVASAEDSRWHRVSGEGHLLPSPEDSRSSDEPEARGHFSEDSLGATISALRGSDQRAVALRRIGPRLLLSTEYPEQIGLALEQIRAALPPEIRLELRLERLTEDGATLLLSGTADFPNGGTKTIADIEQRRIVRDLDVEIASGAATASPVVDSVELGASVAARVRPMPFRDEAVVELVVRTAMPIPAEPLQTHRDFGAIDRIASRVDEAGLSFRIARGADSVHEWIAIDGSRVRLQCKVSWDERPAPAAAAVKVVCSSLLGPPVLGFASSTVAGEPEEPLAATPVAALVEHLRAAAGRDAVPLFEPGSDDGGGVLLLAGKGGERFERALDDELGHALRALQVQVELVDAPAGLRIEAEGALPDGARLVGGFGGPLLASLSTCFASAREQSYVRRHEFEVAQSSRIPDPKIDVVEDGWFATLRVEPDRSGRLRTAELDLSIEQLDELRELSVTANQASIGDAPENPVRLPQDVVRIELPIERRLPWRVAVRLDDEGRAVIRRSASTLFGAGRELVVRLRATAP